MQSVKELRRRGFQYRRVSFALKVLTGVWAVAMVVLAFGGTLVTFIAGVTGLIAFCVPALLIAATYDHMAERQFNKAAATSTLLGVVHPQQ